MSVKEIVLHARPKGKPTDSNFKTQTTELKKLGDGDVQVKSVYFSVDPYLRGRMNEGKSYIPPFEIGQPLVSGAIAEVVESKNSKFKTGDLVTGMMPWATEAVVKGEEFQKIEDEKDHASLHLGVLGMPGLTAYFGLLDIGKPKAGETVLVSGAAGAVGSAVGQIAKIKGCRVVGVAGSDEKVQLLKEKFGFDEVINYKTTKDLDAAVKAACPNGVDVYFDNVGGELTVAAINNMNLHGRIPLCGQISDYNAEKTPTGPLPQMKILSNRLTMTGFIVFDYQARFAEGTKELTQWYKEGKLKAEETVVKGFDKLPEALLGLFAGQNTGKMIVKV